MISTQLAESLLKLNYQLLDVAEELEYYGGFNDVWRQRAAELAGAAAIAKSWGREILET